MAPAVLIAHAAELAFPYGNNFDDAGDGTLTGDATVVDGWLQLTQADNGEAGAWQMTDTFPSDLGIDVRFNYVIHGGTGADGLVFFLTDGAAAMGAGATGAGLGYSQNTAPPGGDGVPGGYVGVAFDTFGNFSGDLAGPGGPGQTPNSIAVRGSGDGQVGYNYITGAPAPAPLQMPGGRAEARPARITIIPDADGDLLLTVWTNAGPGTGMQRVLTNVNLSDAAGQADLPAQLRIGFSAGTGAFTNVHEVDGLLVSVPTDVAITKDGPADALAGEQITYTLVASNPSTVGAPGSRVQDEISATLVDVAWTCAAAGGAVCADASGTGSIDTLADLPPLGQTTYTITGTLPTDFEGELENEATITVAADRNDVDPDNNTASVSTTVTMESTLTAEKSVALLDGDTALNPGEEVDYTIVVTNTGPSQAPSGGATDALPAGFSFVSAVDEACTADGQDVTCDGDGPLEPGETASFTFRALLDPSYTGDGEDLANVAVPTGGTTNVPSDPVSPPYGGPLAALVAEKTAALIAGDTALSPGEAFTYTITVVNEGPSVATQVGATDPLPAGIQFVASPNGACTAVGQDVTCSSGADLAVGESVTFTVTARLAAGFTGNPGTLLNTATPWSPTPGSRTPSDAVPPPGPYAMPAPPAPPQLPVTGATVTGAAGIAALLVAGGVILITQVRRRTRAKD
ncbi:hypothetical protein L1785_11595 [Antribacter sp. KLBMP9083]|uniref:DUF11 domain-containing protein n=1 Tax=Antribacter soli TaxID=2910976 RepID=A0AA41QEE8_9MICO|nr:hypothetical protein [Antribacter soli]MCF4121627.1 hypothetical protein [Antribacter soli]